MCFIYLIVEFNYTNLFYMIYFTLAIIVCFVALIRKIDYFFNYDKRLLVVNILLCINLIIGVLYSYLSSTEFFCISILLNLFNGPLFHYVLFDKSKNLFFFQYFMILVMFIYIIGYSYYINMEDIEIVMFNYFSASISGVIGLLYMLVCYYFLVISSAKIRNESVIIIFIVIMSFESIMLFPDLKDGAFEINPLFIYMGCTVLLILSSFIYLFMKLIRITELSDKGILLIEFDNGNRDIVDVEFTVIPKENKLPTNIIEEEINSKQVIQEKVIEKELYTEDNELSFISLVLNEKLIDSKLFLNPNLTLSSLSKACGISKARLTAFFKSSEASNFNKYINRIRIEYAVILLYDYNPDELSTEKWALLSGFNSRVTFYRSFVDVYGFPPSELLKNSH